MEKTENENSIFVNKEVTPVFSGRLAARKGGFSMCQNDDKTELLRGIAR